ncbi:MAG: response regulator [Deltaproteobacteria bacterium]|jgi:signal transduction histidine kinase
MMPKATNPLQILLIEDNEHDRIAFERAMNRASVDCDLEFCERAEEAENLLKSADSAFDLVVVDFDLPGMNGLDFFKKMRHRKNFPPFVMLTGAGSEKVAVKAMLTGFYDYVVKDAQMGYLNLLPVVLDRTLKRHSQDQARRKAKVELKHAKDELELKVKERTAELAMMIQALENEIEEHRQTEVALRKSQKRLRELSRKILDAQENERKFVAQEIHDSIGGSLAAIKFALEEKLESMAENPSPAVISIEKIISQVDETIKESRRIAARLRPSLLDDLGLLATVSWFCREFEKLHQHIQIEQQLDVAEDEIPEILKVVVYRVMQEAMNNAAKHSDASRIRLHLAKIDNRIEFSLIDNGRGFDPQEKLSRPKGISGLGLSGMRDRTHLSDGKFEIVSKKGKGTTVHISLPCPGGSIGDPI